MKRTTTVLISGLFLWGTGCHGSLDIGFGGPDDGAAPPGAVPGKADSPQAAEVETACTSATLTTPPVRRLTAAEYHATVRDLFGDSSIATQTLSADERVAGFEANTVSSVTQTQAAEYQLAAENIAETVTTDTSALTGCSDASERDCVVAWIEEFGTRAYRRPLTTTERNELVAVYDTLAGDEGPDVAVRGVVEATLQSADFLYRVEVGQSAQGQVVELTPHEIASRLSYYLTGSMPDDALFAAANDGSISEASVIESQARRLLESPRTREHLNGVVQQWLGVDDLNTDKLDDAARQAMGEETTAFIDHVLWEDDATLATLLTADYTFADERLSEQYGDAVTGMQNMQRVALGPERAGILTLPSVLVTHAHATHSVFRGKFVRESLLCLEMHQPPNDLEPLATVPGEPRRAAAERRMNATDEGCAGCHIQMEGTGLVFDQFDRLGRYQTTDENGNELTGDGTIVGTSFNGQISGPGELAAAIADANEARECITDRWFGYAFSRSAPSPDDCVMQEVRTAFDESGGSLKELFVAFVRTDAFRHRTNPTQE